MRLLLWGGCLGLLLAAPLHAQPSANAGLADFYQYAGVAGTSPAPDTARLVASPTRAQQLPLFQAVMAHPSNAPYRAGMLADAFKASADAPHALFGLVGAMAGLRLYRAPETALAPIEARLRAAPDPLADALSWVWPLAQAANAGSGVVPNVQQLPDPLRFELALMLASMGQAHQFLQRALAQMPSSLTPELLRRQALDGDLQLFEAPDYRVLLPLIEREALLAGMLDLLAATERLKRFVSTHAATLPALAWTLDTPAGQIVVDTTGSANHHRLQDPLLVLDVGGNDHYTFLPRRITRPISVLLDHLGNDHYSAATPGADPSSATLGYGLLWDTQGDDHYQGTQQAQAAALFGAAVLIDGGGQNVFEANSQAQGYALGGLALLLGGAGSDTYRAQVDAQASAGPLGVAVLLEPAGNERYTLDNQPLLRPSPQLPDRNASMGQGAGRGIRASAQDGRSLAGGIGLLLDLGGDDHYTAQVFAQGVGYHEGLGLLIDDGGDDQFDAAWYAMGAAAHSAAGVLLKRGTGRDHYRVSHTLALGAGHDFSVGVFLDEGGSDHYSALDLALGLGHDNSTGLFVDLAGDDVYQISHTACRALGSAVIEDWGNLRESLPNTGLFLDLGGQDSYPAQCARAQNNSRWRTAKVWPALALPSETGAGWDGEAAAPFAVRALTIAPPPPAKPMSEQKP